MKNILLITILIFSNSLFAQSIDSLFIQANKLYQKEKYDEALAKYQEIENKNVQSDDLYYNMANAYYKTNQVAPSIFYYEKALMVNPTHEDAKYNLSFAQRMTIDNIEALPKTIGQRFSENIIHKFDYDTWSYGAVTFSLLFAVLFLLYHFSYNSVNKRFYFISSILCAFFIIITVLFAYNNQSQKMSYKTAIIFAQQSDVKSAPTNGSEISFELHEGTKVELLESLDDWKKIKIADGKIGWILAKDIRELQ